MDAQSMNKLTRMLSQHLEEKSPNVHTWEYYEKLISVASQIVNAGTRPEVVEKNPDLYEVTVVVLAGSFHRDKESDIVQNLAQLLIAGGLTESEETK